MIPSDDRSLCSIERGNRLQRTLRFMDSAAPTRKAKPAGALGFELWSKVGTTTQREKRTCRSSPWTLARRT